MDKRWIAVVSFLIVTACTRYGDQPITVYSCDDLPQTLIELKEPLPPTNRGKKIMNRMMAATGAVFGLPWLVMDFSDEDKAAIRPYEQPLRDIDSQALYCRPGLLPPRRIPI